MTETNKPINPKIIDLIKLHEASDRKDEPLISLEYFPPRTAEGVKNLHARMDRMLTTLSPAFTDITWGAGGSTADLSLELALYLQRTGHVANLHMTCTNMGTSEKNPKEVILEALQAAYDGGIRNLVALRGDPPAGQSEWKAVKGGFTCALDLVKFVKEHQQFDFGIAVAGYPEGHPNAISEIDDPSTLTATEKARCSTFDGKTYCCLDDDYKKEMDYLKQKVDAGADLIITQMFFDAGVFATFLQDCRKWGITCPVVPGLMCINAYAGFCKMTKFCKTRVPDALREKMESLKDDAAAVKEFGMDFGADICRQLLALPDIKVLHFYTLNLEKVVYGVLDRLGVTNNALGAANEADAASQIAKGSAWARVGDIVQTLYGKGVVMELDGTSGAATVQIDSWVLAAGQKPIAYLQKGAYSKEL